ncbi:MAG: SGNH/GDSL hydrolase family protein [Eubacteriales bacterium]|nr:SGNH/GDSL hydrolase family protein [Eubacteriales bacterium]
MSMNIFQRMMYVVLSITVACAVSVANYIYLPADKRIPSDSYTTDFLERYYDTNDRILKSLFPYEEPNYTLEVPANMSYTTADFQQFSGTYLTEREPLKATDYFPSICFCGDSITYHMGLAGRPLQNYDVLAYGGLSVYDYATYTTNPVYNKSTQIKTSIQWLKELQPDIIYIMLGTNGIALNSLSNDTHIALYNTLLDKIVAASPSSIIVICSSPPWGTDAYNLYTNQEVSVINQKINHFNMYLLEMAKARGFYYLNVAEALMDSSGYLEQRYSVGDGIHWSDLARSVYVDYVLKHAIPGY